MLHARINREYIDDDEMAKKITFERTLAWVKLYPEEAREVAMQQGTLSGSELYAFDNMFESFRNSIETVLSSDYHDQTTHEKSNEVIKKYNQISSYLKNIVNMNKLTEQDESKIKNEFNSLRAKLEQLKRIAIDNNFSDQHDIVQMVDKINDTSNGKKAEYAKISAESPEMIKAIVSKEQAKQVLNNASTLVATLDQSIDLLKAQPSYPVERDERDERGERDEREVRARSVRENDKREREESV